MAELGKRNSLAVLRDTTPGLFLDGGALGEILLPKRYIEDGTEVGDVLDVFVYRDSEDRLVATTEEPFAWVGEFALFEVVGFTPGIGAFLDWGLAKDLLLPIREQARRVRVGEWIVAAVVLDKQSDRIIASTRLNRYLNLSDAPYHDGQPVRFMLAEKTDLGYKAIVENAHWGLLYQTDLATPMELGQFVDGYIRLMRPDGKIDLSLDPAGYDRVGPLALQIIAALEANNGRLEFNDKSSPESIRATFATSKKAFKQAVGSLLKDERIVFKNDGIELVEED
ncbi:MAG: S1-like domain-containing RNA-binding protein [Verrucomicrobiota bacterium]